MEQNKKISVVEEYEKLLSAVKKMPETEITINPFQRLALAYYVEQNHTKPEYEKEVAELISLAEKGDCNEFSMKISLANRRSLSLDSVTTEGEMSDVDEVIDLYKEFYDKGELDAFWIVKMKHLPKWLSEYEEVQRVLTKNNVINYLKNECNVSEGRAIDMYDKLVAEPDILDEFASCIKSGKFEFCTFKPITVEGYTAQMLKESTYLSFIGAYNYLISLRKDPKQALQDLKNGLPRK